MSYDDCVYLKEGLIEPINEVIGRERGGGGTEKEGWSVQINIQLSSVLHRAYWWCEGQL